MTSAPGPTILVVASTFPASPTDTVPAFVRDQILALRVEYPTLRFTVLAPHEHGKATRATTRHEEYVEHRFHYAWPRRLEQLTARGIMPSLRERPWRYLLVPFLFVGEWWACLSLVRRERPALIYAHWFTPQGLVAAVVGAMTRTPFVFTTHASDVAVWRRVPLLGTWVVRWAARRAVAASAVSTRSLAKLTAFFPDGDVGIPLHIIPMGVDEFDPPSEPRPQPEDDTTTYLFIGRLVEKKGVEYLLDALHDRRDRLGPWRLLVAGDGPDRASLEARSRRLGLENRVEFLGYVTGDAKTRCFDEADVLVAPSTIASDGDTEGLPVSILEGLARGLPVVATDVSGADDILTDGVDGFLCQQRDVVGLGDALERVHALDQEGLDAVRTLARKRSAQFAWPVIARRHHEALFAPVLGAGTPR